MKRFLLFLLLAAVILLVSVTVYRLLKPSNPPPITQNEQTPTPNLLKPGKKEIFEQNNKLQTETDALLPLFGQMPQVPVFVKDEIINKEGSNTERGVAYTACENKNEPVIFVKKIFYEEANRKQLVNILKHELTHAWLCRQNLMPVGHGEAFRRKFKQVGGFGN